MAASLSKITNSEVLYQFIHYCVDELVTKTNSNFTVSSDDLEWTKDEQLAAMDFIQNVFRVNVLNKNQEFNVPDSVNPKLVSIIKECYNIRKEQIFQAILREELYKTENNIVENIDWKLKWIMGSSKLATIREPLLQVDLHCFLKENESIRKTINCEMNLNQLDELIEDLERVTKLLAVIN